MSIIRDFKVILSIVLGRIRFVCLQKTIILTRPRVFMNVDGQKTSVGEGRGSPLVLKPVQRRQHQCFVLRSVIFSVT